MSWKAFGNYCLNFSGVDVPLMDYLKVPEKRSEGQDDESKVASVPGIIVG